MPNQSPQIIPVFVLNLDRRPDRIDFMAPQLEQLGIHWTRFSALDAQTATDEEISLEVDMTSPLIRMGRGSQCCAIGNFNIFRKIVTEGLDAAVIMQDDIQISPELSDFLTNTDWIPDGIGIVQFEHFGSNTSKRLCDKGFPTPVPSRQLHRLHSRTAGAGCFLVTQAAAQEILQTKPLLRTPIDHYMFSPNVPNHFDEIGVGLVLPSLAVQKMKEIQSDISAERQKTKTKRERILRLWLELNRTPQQILALIKGARWLPFEFRE